MNIKILDSNLGVERILEAETSGIRLPQATPLAHDNVSGSSLESLFSQPTFKNIINQYLKPEIINDDMLRPDILGRNLETSLAILREAAHPAIRRFVRDDLEPLMDDTQLLKAYAGLMMDG